MEDKELPLVSIRCITYNHEPYIRQCLEGFVMQKTNFRFEAVVHDDASTDKTADIIREYAEKYPDIIKPIYETENQYSKHDGSLTRILSVACTGKYIALCEGDDYWIDPLKLQKQVDFLEANYDYSLIGSNGIIQYTDISHGLRYFNNHFYPRQVMVEELVDKWTFPTASLLYRRSVKENYPQWTKQIYSGDQTLIMIAASKGKVATTGDISCVYRKGSGVTSFFDKQMVFVKKQQKLLYTHLLEYMDKRYSQCLQKRILRDEADIRFFTLKEKSLMMTLLFFPRRVMSEFIYWLINKMAIFYRNNFIK